MDQSLPPSGIDLLLEDEALLSHLSQNRVGFVTNQNALTKDHVLSALALQKKIGKALTCILTPEHGWSGQMAEGVKVTDGFDPSLKLPLYSLYGGAKALETFDIDTLVIDLQDIGVRCYTYATSCAKLLEAIADVNVIICDRPNPLGPKQKGPLLDPHFRSFVGYLNVPFQHGQTMGELLSSYKNLTVLSCQHDHQPYQYPWVSPSPNLPTWDSVLLYPALVLLEGTNISEGRGTNLPFTCLGAPDLDESQLVDFLNTIKGIQANPLTFKPLSGKLMGRNCRGAHILITDFEHLDAFSMGLKIIEFLKEKYSLFEWTPMESQKEGFFIDYLLGTDAFRKSIE